MLINKEASRGRKQGTVARPLASMPPVDALGQEHVSHCNVEDKSKKKRFLHRENKRAPAVVHRLDLD